MTTPIDNLEPSLALNIVASPTQGVFPSGGGGGTATGDTLGFLYDFAGDYVPGGFLAADGQSLTTSSAPLLYDLIGTVYGGTSGTYDLPNLSGHVEIGTDASEPIGVNTGIAAVTLTTPELPPPQGSAQPFTNLQPSLPVETLIATAGTYPTSGGNSGTSSFIGQIGEFAGTFVPSGWMLAAGQLLPISGNSALFSVLGTQYGGDGTTDFALPNLQGAVAVGADAAHPIGTTYGQASTTLTTAEMPPNGSAVPNDQPSVALTYLIATSGLFPTDNPGFNATTETVGEIVAFAGNFAPSGWALANGQTLSIAANMVLFDVIGTTYGGDANNFVLPDLDGRTVIGADGSNYIVGSDYGADATILTEDNLPSPACYMAGTMIATPAGEVPIERLSIGDQVLTAAGPARTIRWIGRRDYGGRFLQSNPSLLPIRFRAGSLGGGVPRRDLLVSPKHAMFIDDLLIPSELLENGSSVLPAEPMASLSYLHIELDSHDVLLAEGAPSESFVDCDSRMMFQNAHEFPWLYPQGLSESWAFCAERIEDGARLETIRRRIAAHAGLAGCHTEDAAEPAKAESSIDVANCWQVSGWAFDPTRPHTPLHLQVMVDGAVMGITVANTFRADLAAAGMGHGRCAFAYRFPEPLAPEASHLVSLLVSPIQALEARVPAARPSGATCPGSLDGRIDLCDAASVSGWAFDSAWPELPVRLELLRDGVVYAVTDADRYRPDLAAAGIGDGRCAFHFDTAGTEMANCEITVRRSSDGALVAVVPLGIAA